MRTFASGRPPRARRVVFAAAACLLVGGATLPAVADDDGTPSQAEVDAAKDAVADQKHTVAGVRAELQRANERLEAAAVRAAQAAEAFNAARWKLGEAKVEARKARHRQELADKSLSQQQRLFDGVVALSYEAGLQLSPLSALGEGIEEIGKKADATYQVTSSMSDIKDNYEAAAEVAELAGDEAREAQEDAEALASQAAAARAEARAQATWAMRQAEKIADRKRQLLTELADLQDISVELATERQADLEAQAQAEAAAQAAAEAAEQAQQQQEQEQEQEEEEPDNPDQPDPTPTPDPDPEPDPEPPAPSGGASAAISFARAQLGEPYRWGADGPDAWDCSGLTMRAWQSGGKSLPHYSVGQYQTSTPISVGQLRPGDLVFWASSNDPNSIFHVALYIGDNRIIHAPRTGRTVTEDSLYYWVPPTFFARP